MNPEEAKHLARDYMRAFQDEEYERLEQPIAPEFVRHDELAEYRAVMDDLTLQKQLGLIDA